MFTPIIFFTSFIVLFAGLMWLVSYTKWKESQKLYAWAKGNPHTPFEGVRVDSFSTGRLKLVMGFEVRANFFFLNDELIITPAKMNYKLMHTLLPLMLQKRDIKKVKRTTWNTIVVTLQKHTLSVGNAKITLTIKPNDKNQQSEMHNKLICLCNLA